MKEAVLYGVIEGRLLGAVEGYHDVAPFRARRAYLVISDSHDAELFGIITGL